MQPVYYKIISLIVKNGFTVHSFEKELGFSNGTISRWESSSPPSDKLCKVADYFDISIDSLLGRTGKFEPFFLTYDLSIKTIMLINELISKAYNDNQIEIISDYIKGLNDFWGE